MLSARRKGYSRDRVAPANAPGAWQSSIFRQFAGGGSSFCRDFRYMNCALVATEVPRERRCIFVAALEPGHGPGADIPMHAFFLQSMKSRGVAHVHMENIASGRFGTRDLTGDGAGCAVDVKPGGGQGGHRHGDASRLALAARMLLGSRWRRSWYRCRHRGRRHYRGSGISSAARLLLRRLRLQRPVLLPFAVFR